MEIAERSRARRLARAAPVLNAAFARRFYPGSLAVPLGAALGMAAGALVPAADLASKLRRKSQEDTSYAEAEAREAAAELGKVLQQLAIGSVPSSLMSAREAAAWERVDGILATGDGDGVKLSAMLAVLPMHVTEGSSAQRTLAESAWASGLPPHPHAFNTMLSQLQLEARGAEALAALQAEMSRMGVEANAETRDVLMRSENELEKLHGYELCRLLRWGRRQDHDGQPAVSTAAAWDLWERLLRARRARPRHLVEMLANGCIHSDEQERLMVATTSKYGVVPDASVYATLISRLQLEGQPQVRIDELLEQMEQIYGVAPNDELQKVLRRTPRDLSALRTAWLTKLLKGAAHSRDGHGQRFYSGLLKR